MIRVIRDEGTVHKWDLVDLARISIRDYTNLSSYMRHRFDGQIKYDPNTSTWSKLNQLDDLKIEQQEKLSDVEISKQKDDK